jgi:hypothetical protein
MPISKDRISSPLEAGPSILDAKQLPPELTSALDYVSERLARKRLHISLIVVRKDINIPGLPSPQLSKSTEAPAPSITTSPVRSLFNSASSTFTRSISKHSSQASISDVGSTVSASSSASLSRTTWPGLPSSPQDRRATPPLSQVVPTPSPQLSTRSISSPATPTTLKSNPYGISLIHASTLTAKAEKILRHTIAKAEKKYTIG